MSNPKVVQKITGYLKDNYFIVIVIIVGFFLRIYDIERRFTYGHDQDLLGWFVRDVVENGHFRLIGQETSTHGIFIGPLFYYLVIPFYFLTGMNPLGSTLLVALFGVITIISFYYVGMNVFNKNVGLIAALLYSLSYATVFNDRDVVPTTPVFLWSVWYFYSLNLLLNGNHKKGLILSAILIGLIWHLNFALALLVPLVPIAIYISKKRVNKKSLRVELTTLFIVNLPLIIFELRHGFLQTKALIVSLTTNQKDILGGVDKFGRVIYIIQKNLHTFIVGSMPWLKYEYVFYIAIITFILLFVKNKINKNISFIMLFWFFFYITFFTFYSKILSEYYLNGLLVIWIYILSVGLASILDSKIYRYLAIVTLSIFAVFNINKFFSVKVSTNRFKDKMEVIREIKNNATNYNYPCVSISYITDPGYELGYRYLFYIEGLKTKPISGEVPTYTIVFPLKKIFPTDYTSGTIGLIWPDHSRYIKETVLESCEGEDYNLTNPMFGFTK